MNMMPIEVLIITAVLFYLTSYALKEQKPKVFLIKFLTCATAAWIAEESCIKLYEFYTYGPAWNFFIVDVPLVVIVVWPAIIHSATALSSNLLTQDSRLIPTIAGVIVLTDALLIEPISVNCDLWRWYEPGVFGVPWIGFFGWAYFAFFSVGFFVPLDRPSKLLQKLTIKLLVSVIGTHLFLLISYWTIFKWTEVPVSSIVYIGAVWIISALIFSFFIFTKIGCRVKFETLFVRLPAALFFYILLFVLKDTPTSLIIYSLAFIPPYIAIGMRSYVFNQPLEYTKRLPFKTK